MSDSKTSGQPESQLPQQVVAGLRHRLKTSVPIPSDVDRTILSDAHEALSAIRKPEPVQKVQVQWNRRSWALGLASAGSLAAALLVVLLPQRDQTEMPRGNALSMSDSVDESSSWNVAGSLPTLVASLQKEDIDGNGRVDILDAFALARRVQRPDVDVMANDQNSDGVLDRSDVDLIAMSAVML